MVRLVSVWTPSLGDPLPLRQSQGHVDLHLCLAMAVTMLQANVAWDCCKEGGSCMLGIHMCVQI